MLASDVSKLDELIADSLIFTAFTGALVDKQTDLKMHQSGLIEISELIPSEQIIQVYDNFAVVTVKMQISGSFDDQPSSGNYRFTRVWAKPKNHWQVVAGHVSEVLS